jgi:hypothetical protein
MFHCFFKFFVSLQQLLLTSLESGWTQLELTNKEQIKSRSDAHFDGLLTIAYKVQTLSLMSKQHLIFLQQYLRSPEISMDFFKAIGEDSLKHISSFLAPKDMCTLTSISRSFSRILKSQLWRKTSIKICHYSPLCCSEKLQIRGINCPRNCSSTDTTHGNKPSLHLLDPWPRWNFTQ